MQWREEIEEARQTNNADMMTNHTEDSASRVNPR